MGSRLVLVALVTFCINLLGAIAGDMIGSVFESKPVKSKNFTLFSPGSSYTDDSVLTLAVASALLTGSDYASIFRAYYRQHPDRGYGAGFRRWVDSPETCPCYSYGNGSAMRAGPIGWAFNSLDEVLAEAKTCAVVTHNHADGIKGAQAVAAAVYLARHGSTKPAIRSYITSSFNYDLDRTLNGIRPGYTFTTNCEGSVPEAILAFLESSGFEDAVRNAISLGGDSDTMACIAGAIAEAYYKEPDPDIHCVVFARLPENLARTALHFNSRFCN